MVSQIFAFLWYIVLMNWYNIFSKVRHTFEKSLWSQFVNCLLFQSTFWIIIVVTNYCISFSWTGSMWFFKVRFEWYLWSQIVHFYGISCSHELVKHVFAKHLLKTVHCRTEKKLKVHQKPKILPWTFSHWNLWPLVDLCRCRQHL